MLALYLALAPRLRNGLLAAVSLVFYAWGAHALLLFFLASIAVNYVAGLSIARARDLGNHERSRRIMWVAVGANLAALLFWKYTVFAVTQLSTFSGAVGGGDIDSPSIVLPLGISFFTFHGISYVVDLYRGTSRPMRSVVDYTQYIAFFPQLVAGPIVRYHEIDEQIRHPPPREQRMWDIAEGFPRFALGLSKKVVVADPLGAVVAAAFDGGGSPSFAVAWIGALAYTVQIYFDFSGYSDMAIGLARMFGLRLPENFRRPYSAVSVTDFWRRWHMTLSRWFRDYLYIPLGGSHGSQGETVRNLMVVFFLTGIWHGAAWTFVLWGLFHGTVLVVERLSGLAAMPGHAPSGTPPRGHVPDGGGRLGALPSHRDRAGGGLPRSDDPASGHCAGPARHDAAGAHATGQDRSGPRAGHRPPASRPGRRATGAGRLDRSPPLGARGRAGSTSLHGHRDRRRLLQPLPLLPLLMADAPDPLAPEEPPRPRAPRPPRALGAALAVLALMFFGAPLVLILLGASGSRIEGERAAHVPRFDEGWEAFDSGARYLAEHLPGRARAVQANNFIAKDVLGGRAVYGTAAAPGAEGVPSGNVTGANKRTDDQTGGASAGNIPVVEGLHGWSFLQGDLDVTCHPPVGLGTALRRWSRLVSIIRASGRRVVLLFAPEKSTIYSENLGPETVNRDCALAAKRRAWARIEASPDSDLIPLRRPLMDLKQRSEEQLYFSENSHWNDIGAIELARRALEHVGGATVRIRPDEERRGTGRIRSDLARFHGEDQSATTPTITIARPGNDKGHARFRKIGGVPALVTTHAVGPAPVLRGTTVFIHDSYGNAPFAMLTHYAQRLVDLGWPLQDPENIVPVIRSADTVIIEAVERSFWKLPVAARGGSVLSPRNLTRLQRALLPR